MDFAQCLFILLSIGFCESYHFHRNPCLPHTVEAKARSVADYFGSANLFFPYEYREVYCNTYSSSSNLNGKLSTCAGGLYYCITQYETREYLEIPNKEPLYFSNFNTRTIRIAVGCTCQT